MTAIANLSRVDGVLLLPSLVLVLLLATGWRRSLSLSLVALAVYSLAMAPWLLRNLAVTGSSLPSGGSAGLFLTEYNDLFSYGEELSLAFLLQNGPWAVAADKIAALVKNLNVLYGGAYYLAPFALLGAWSWRREARLLPVAVYALLLYLTFALLFTYPGVRGSMKHSAVALLPWTSLLAVHGIYTAVAWVSARRPGWTAARAQVSFTAIALLFSGVLAIFVSNYEAWARDRYFQRYVDIHRWMEDNAPEGSPVMLTNPPAYAFLSQRSSISTPSNGVGPLLAAADRYSVSILALELDHARALDLLYSGEATHPRLEKVADVGTTRMYRILPQGPPRHGE